MTFNVRLARTDDGPDNWDLRTPLLLDVIRDLDPDILATQEPYIEQVEAIGAGLPGHRRVGVGRDDGADAGEWCAIFVRATRFDVVESGNFWLSETPSIAGSRSWDAFHHPRLCTWTIVADKAGNGRRVAIFNSHWDNEGIVARNKAAALISAALADRPAGIPAIVTGDFNCTPDSVPVRYLNGLGSLAGFGAGWPPSPRLHDAWTMTHSDTAEPSGTYHGFRGGVDGDRIDYILTMDGVYVVSCEIIRTNRAGRYPSDHFPVKALLQI